MGKSCINAGYTISIHWRAYDGWTTAPADQASTLTTCFSCLAAAPGSKEFAAYLQMVYHVGTHGEFAWRTVAMKKARAPKRRLQSGGLEWFCQHMPAWCTSKANQGLLPIAAWQTQWDRMKDRNWSSAFRVEQGALLLWFVWKSDTPKSIDESSLFQINNIWCTHLDPHGKDETSALWCSPNGMNGGGVPSLISRKPAPCPEQTGDHSQGDPEGQSSPGLHQAPCCSQFWFLASTWQVRGQPWSTTWRMISCQQISWQDCCPLWSGVARCLHCLQGPTQLFFSSAWNSSTLTKQRCAAI